MTLSHNQLYHKTGALHMHYTAAASSCQEDTLTIAPGTVLNDTTSTGRAVPWHTHKQGSAALAVPLALLDPAAAARMEHCADRLSFRRDWQDPARPGRLRLAQAYFCRVRVCPMCQWRRSLKAGGQLRACINYLAAQRAAAGRKPYAYILLTLTVPNVPGPALAGRLDLIQSAWQRLVRRKEYRAAVQGAVRCVEITYNRQRADYHPHVHALLAVNPSYFTSRAYLPQARWLELWRACTGLDSITQVDVRKTTGDGDAVAEVVKYATKTSDLLDPSDLDATCTVLGDLMRACNKRRFIGWSGVLRDAHKALALDDTDDGDLIHTGYDDIGESAAGAALWHWDYYIGPRLYLSAGSTMAQV